MRVCMCVIVHATAVVNQNHTEVDVAFQSCTLSRSNKRLHNGHVKISNDARDEREKK